MQSTRTLKKKMYKVYSCIGYILPLVAAVATAVVTIVLMGIKNYLTDNVCWLRSNPLIISGFIGLTLSMTLITIIAIILVSKNFRNAKSENLEKRQEEFSIYKSVSRVLAVL
ncbi:hypothetical protein TrispH2_011859 [Trichoplax sp. H2]|nr:hypothetical protein TrispH2_011859 [Trichoplax sp. H2]|eukprot:RDD35990.1 hypothetical protein TrispH2_011859 [Trichoplax sp. H2]